MNNNQLFENEVNIYKNINADTEIRIFYKRNAETIAFPNAKYIFTNKRLICEDIQNHSLEVKWSEILQVYISSHPDLIGWEEINVRTQEKIIHLPIKYDGKETKKIEAMLQNTLEQCNESENISLEEKKERELMRYFDKNRRGKENVKKFQRIWNVIYEIHTTKKYGLFFSYEQKMEAGIHRIHKINNDEYQIKFWKGPTYTYKRDPQNPYVYKIDKTININGEDVSFKEIVNGKCPFITKNDPLKLTECIKISLGEEGLIVETAKKTNYYNRDEMGYWELKSSSGW